MLASSRKASASVCVPPSSKPNLPSSASCPEADPNSGIQIVSRHQASASVRRIAHLTSLLNQAIAARDAEMLAAQERHAPLIGELSKDIASAQKNLREWADANRKEEFGSEQSVEFPNGWLRYRL